MVTVCNVVVESVSLKGLLLYFISLFHFMKNKMTKSKGHSVA